MKKLINMYITRPTKNVFALFPFVNIWTYPNNILLCIGWGKWSITVNFDKTIRDIKKDFNEAMEEMDKIEEGL